MQAVFHGSATALITPFTENGIDFPALERLLERQLDAGIRALVILGTTGEPSTMTAEEKQAVLSFSSRVIRGRVPLIAGTGGNDTRRVIEDTAMAARCGADAALIVTPYYNKTTQRGLVLHYEMIDEVTDLPFIVYNVPSRTGLNLTPATMQAISRLPHCAGLKDAASSVTQMLETMRLCPNLPLYCGADELNYPYLACGAAGLISVVSNVCPGEIEAMCLAVECGQFEEALSIHQKLSPLTAALFAQTNPIPVKEALCLMGLCDDTLRPPLFPMEDEERQKLAGVLSPYLV